MLQTSQAPRAIAEKVRQRQLQWCDWASTLVGVWILASTLSFPYLDKVFLVSDLLSGAAITLFGLIAVLSKREWPRWPIALVGCWLLLAPLVFWAQSARAYEFDTLMGCLAIAFTFLIPGVTGQPRSTESGAAIPPGWSYNPSSWEQRLPLIWMGMIGFFAARYLAGYQLGYMPSVWDPFFGQGTERVLSSSVSQSFPVSDAGLGATSYLVDALAGAVGSFRRWRTMPWMVLLFGLLIIPAGVTSIVLVMLQPIAVGAWCSICLFTAALMLFMVPLAFDEVIATCQFLKDGTKEGKSFWKLLFLGDEGEDGAKENEAADRGPIAGVTLPWNLAAVTAVGVAVMACPALLGQTTQSFVEYIAGALALTISVCSWAEPCRMVRLLNVPVGVWLMFSVFNQPIPTCVILARVILGMFLIVLSLPKGRIEEKYGSWNRFIV